MTTKQDRRIKAEKAAVAKAEEIIAEAKERVTRKRALPPEHAALAEDVKRLREAGKPWWQIGYELSLPGSADNVDQGKSGAAYARRIYAAAFGEVPRVQKRDGSRKDREKNEAVKELKRTKKVERVEAVRTGSAVLNENMSDEEVLDMLRGRVVGWSINLHTLDGKGEQFAEQESAVHPRYAKIETHSGVRCIAFREFDPYGPVKYRDRPGATRVVRLSSIHTVR